MKSVLNRAQSNDQINNKRKVVLGIIRKLGLTQRVTIRVTDLGGAEMRDGVLLVGLKASAADIEKVLSK